ncbi:MAG: plc [Symbiobacteriaceae bacterium]|jgi:phospholipase C|nr:plc [Symbiobacteriaceae bacterium]
MQYVGLKTQAGTYLGVQEDGRLIASRTTLTPAAVFEWLGTDGSHINLRSIATGQRLALSWESFELVDLDALMAEAQSQRSCCGHAHCHLPATPPRRKTLAPQWREETHAQVVDTAFYIISLHRAIDGAVTLLTLWNNPTFKAALHRGLIDADAFGNLTYTGILYEKHFYDPDTRTNYFGFTAGTAMTEGLRYFRAAASHLADLRQNLAQGRPLPPDQTDCMGYKLGLSLHYFTDLTQPMHAANFANVFASGQLHDWRHSGFETYAETNRHRFIGDPQHVRRDQIDPNLLGFTNPADILHTVAVNAKRIYVDHVGPLAEQKLQEHPLLPPSIDSTWGAEADPALKEALPYGQNMTAAFLLYWAAFS